MNSNKVEHTSSLGSLMPLEERIVLDAALMLDIGSMTFLDRSDYHYYSEGAEALYLDKVGTDSTAFHLDADRDAVHLVDQWFEDQTDDSIMRHEPIVIDLDMDQSETSYDLSAIYPASDILAQMGMVNFEMIDNDNPDNVSAEIEYVNLNLEYSQDFIGETNVIIRGTYLDGKVYETPFRIQSNTTSFENPWLPLEPKTYAFDEASDQSFDDHIPHENIDKLMAHGDVAVKELSGFFGQKSFEDGNWAMKESSE